MTRLNRGQLYRSGEGRVWMMRYVVPRPGGKRERVKETSGTRDRAEAEEVLRKAVSRAFVAREKEEPMPTPKTRRVTVGDLLDALVVYWREKGVKDLNESGVAALRKIFGHRRAEEITIETVRAYRRKRLAEGMTNATVNRGVDALKRAFAVAAREKRILQVPTFPEKLSERGNVRQGFLDQAQVNRLVSRLQRPLDDMVRFAFATGWRQGEVRGLRWEWVTANEIRLPDSKNGAPRSLSIAGADLSAMFERLRKARTFQTASGTKISEFVFHRQGRPMGKGRIGREWRRACCAVGLGRREGLDGKGAYSGAIFHDMRRSAVRSMIRGGVPEAVAMKVSGHKTRSMLDRYNIVDTKDTAVALELARKWNAAQEPETATVAEIGER